MANHYYSDEDLAWFPEIGKNMPDLAAKFFDWYGAVFADGALSAREKSIIALAVAVLVAGLTFSLSKELIAYCFDPLLARKHREHHIAPRDVGLVFIPLQSVIGARPISTTPPHWPCEVSSLSPSTLSRLVKMIGWVAEPIAETLLPRLTASHDWPVAP